MLAPGEVEIAIARPEEIDDPTLLAAYDALMTEDERKRQRAFVFEKNRQESLVTRALVRTTLSRHRPVAPQDWRFVTNEWGCPRIEPDCGLSFNLSNHPTMVVCAVTEGGAIGVDVEPHDRAQQILGLARDVFAPSEQEALAALRPDEREDRALSLWTSKEAYIKARGMGLAIPLDGFAFAFEEPLAPRIAFEASVADDPERWRFRIMDVAGHRVALAVERRAAAEPSVRVRMAVPLRP